MTYKSTLLKRFLDLHCSKYMVSVPLFKCWAAHVRYLTFTFRCFLKVLSLFIWMLQLIWNILAFAHNKECEDSSTFIYKIKSKKIMKLQYVSTLYENASYWYTGSFPCNIFHSNTAKLCLTTFLILIFATSFAAQDMGSQQIKRWNSPSIAEVE